MTKLEKQEKLIAKMRQKEIARKVAAQRLQASGYVPSQHQKVTQIDRLVEQGHYRLDGGQAQVYYLKESLKRLKDEAKRLNGQKIVLVKR